MTTETATTEDIEYVTDFAKDTICALLAEPEVADFSTEVKDNSILLGIRASRQECGRVIGRDGAVIRAINVLCHAIARKNRCYIRIDLANNEGQDG